MVLRSSDQCVGVVNGIATDVAGAHVARNMEVDGVARQHECLADILELTVLDSANDSLIAWGVKHDMSAVLVLARGLRVASVDDVPGEKTDLGSHLNPV